MCQQNNLHIRGPEQHPEPAAPLAVFNTPFFWSLSLPILEAHKPNYLPFTHSPVGALMQPQSVHLLHSLFLHIYLQFHAYSHMALLTLLCHTARHGACHTGVTDAAFPPVTQLLMSPNHSAAAQENLQGFLQLIWTCRHFTNNKDNNCHQLQST